MTTAKTAYSPSRMVLADIAQIVGGVVLLLVAAEGIVRAGSALGQRIGLSPLWIGLTIVALGTSAPELVVSVQAARTGAGAVAFGNVIGSNIMNILVVLGFTALIRPIAIEPKTAVKDIPAILVAAFAIALMALGGRVTRPYGLLLIAGAVAYTIYLGRRERVPITSTADADPWSTRSPMLLFAIVAAALVALLIGGRLVLAGAVDLAAAWGLSERVIGLTVVALGTSLPELAVSIAAAIRGRVDLAIGNIVGSNLLNSTLVLGTAALFAPLPIGPGSRYIDVPIMLTATILLWVFALRNGKVSRYEAAIFIGVYGGYLGVILATPSLG